MESGEDVDRYMQWEIARPALAPIRTSKGHQLCLRLRIFIDELGVRNATLSSALLFCIANEMPIGLDL